MGLNRTLENEGSQELLGGIFYLSLGNYLFHVGTRVIVDKGYHSGGASYVLSRESLRRFYAAHKDPKSKCRKDGGSEDIEIASCLRMNGVLQGKSLDKQNRELFHPSSFINHFRGTVVGLEGYAQNPVGTRYNCCGDKSISFHYVNPDEQYFMNFLLYRAHPKRCQL
ncbi:unnamed protein product [Rotaria sp. Silwood2]|nr:unnamed protein product [Rotaria sp. Silwood2]CAF4430910.1 unnamed protein product [Rotaria sp. Silwood2]CAF4573114.1 unnamed protein product [Rotaria sp. Silwood2]